MQIAVRHNALPSSLVAGMCSVCVVASVGAAAPLPAPHSLQAAHSAVATVSHVSTYAEKYYLTAFPADLLQLISLPFTAYQTFLNNLIAGPNEFIKAINTLNAAIYAQTVGPFVARVKVRDQVLDDGVERRHAAIVHVWGC